MSRLGLLKNHEKCKTRRTSKQGPIELEPDGETGYSWANHQNDVHVGSGWRMPKLPKL